VVLQATSATSANKIPVAGDGRSKVTSPWGIQEAESR
jgi:hypothetical protein